MGLAITKLEVTTAKNSHESVLISEFYSYFVY